MDPVSFVAVIAIEAAVNFGISYLFPAQGPRLKDLQVSASSYGVTIPQIFGTARAAGNMIWADAVKEHKQKKQAGKGGSFYNQYTYSCTFAFAFAKGPAQDISRIWADGKLIFDKTGNSSGVNNSKYTFTVYLGGEDQMPDPTMEALVGAGRTPAYRGLCYILFQDFLMTDFGNRIPQFAAQVSGTVAANNDTPFTDIVNEMSSVFTNTDDAATAGTYGPALDLQRGYIWLRGNGSSGSGLRRYRMSDSVEDLQLLHGDVGLTSVDGLVACAPNGTIYVTSAGSLVGLDPVSHQIIGTGTGVGTISDPGCVSNDGSKVYNACFVAGTSTIHNATTCSLIQSAPNPFGVSGTFHVAPYLNTDFVVGSSDTTKLYLTSTSAGVLHIETVSTPHMVFTCWDQGSPGVIFGYTDATGSWIAKFSTDTSTIIWRTQVGGLATLFGGSRITNSKIAWAEGGNAYIIDTVSGELVIVEQTQYLANVGALGFRGSFGNVVSVVQGNLQSKDATFNYAVPSDTPLLQIFDAIRQSLVCFGADSAGGTPNRIVHAGLFTGAGTSLDIVVGNLLQQGGLLTTDFDVSGLASVPINGYGFANNSDIKGILSELRQVYLFDLYESDFMLKARLRGGSVADVTIDARCLGSSSEDVRDEWKATRIQEPDLPALITLAYMDINNDFQTATAHYRRPIAPIPTMFSKQQAAVQANLVLDGTSAKTLVRTMLFTQWQERTKHDSRLPWTYAYLDPSDLLSVNFTDGRNYLERINRTELGADGTIVMESFSQDAGAYEANASLLGDAGTGTAQVVAIPPPAKPLIYNGPLLRDSDDIGPQSTAYYTALGNDGGATAIFMGGSLYGSVNNADYDLIYSTPNDVEWGIVRGTVPASSRGINAVDLDTQITIVPAINAFTLESITEDELWNGANPLIVGKEVIQFRDVVQNSDGSWTVSYLLRGRRATSYAISTHTAGETVIAPTSDTLLRQIESLSAAGQTRYYSAVADGTSITSGELTNLVYYPRDLMPYPVADIRRAIATPGSQSDITITWSRCTRTGGGLMDSTGDVPLNETSEAYEVYVLNAPFAGDFSLPNAPTTASVVRKFTPTSPTVTYLSADQTTDGFATPSSTLHVVIYQLSGAVGRGFPHSRSIEFFRPY